MKGISLPIKTVVALILAALALAVIASVFLLGVQLSPAQAQKIFSEGCVSYCAEISSRASASGERLEIVAVRMGEELKGSLFIAACNFLYPDTTGYPYLCWNRNCCRFSLPPP